VGAFQASVSLQDEESRDYLLLHPVFCCVLGMCHPGVHRRKIMEKVWMVVTAHIEGGMVVSGVAHSPGITKEEMKDIYRSVEDKLSNMLNVTKEE
jgi:hypothetical protein